MNYQSNNYNPHSIESKVSKYIIVAVATIATSIAVFYLDGISSKDDGHRRNVLNFTQNVRSLIVK